jgi:hypothetical protein
MECLEQFLRRIDTSFLEMGDGLCLDRFPLRGQRLDDGGAHQPLHVFAGGVMGAELVTVVGIQGTFQQGAENDRLDVAPVRLY